MLALPCIVLPSTAMICNACLRFATLGHALEGVLGRLGSVLGRLRAALGRLGSVLRRLGAALEASSSRLGGISEAP